MLFSSPSILDVKTVVERREAGSGHVSGHTRDLRVFHCPTGQVSCAPGNPVPVKICPWLSAFWGSPVSEIWGISSLAGDITKSLAGRKEDLGRDEGLSDLLSWREGLPHFFSLSFDASKYIQSEI